MAADDAAQTGSAERESVDPDAGWRTTSVTLELSGRSPPLGDYFNYVPGFYSSSETVHEAHTPDLETRQPGPRHERHVPLGSRWIPRVSVQS